MNMMIAGLVVFLGIHSVRVFANRWRSAQIARFGEPGWKALYSVASAVGLAVAIWGFGQMRLDPVHVWFPPAGLRHGAAVLMIPAFILLVAAYVPRNHVRAALGHPMLLAVKLWAFAHLLVNGRLGDIIFFGAFLLWAVLTFRAARRRDRASGVQAAESTWSGTGITMIVGLLVFYLFAFHLHVWVTGVAVFA